MSPEAFQLASRRIAIDVHEAQRIFKQQLAQKQAEYSGAARFSSGMVHDAFEMARTELERRALSAWATIKRILDADDSEPNDETIGKISELIHGAVASDSTDVVERYERARPTYLGSSPSLDESLQRAINLAMSEAGIDMLRRRRKRLPLGDVLRAPRYEAVLIQWTAARAAAESDTPDIAAAGRGAVLAIESLAKRVVPTPCATLGDCIHVLRSKKLIDKGADKLMEGLWTYANSTPGLRHGDIRQVSLIELDWAVLRPMFEAALVLLLRVDAASK